MSPWDGWLMSVYQAHFGADAAKPPACDDCGLPLRSADSGHGVCLYCRLPDLLDHQAHVALQAASDRVKARLYPLCPCDECAKGDPAIWRVAQTVERAAELVLERGDVRW